MKWFWSLALVACASAPSPRSAGTGSTPRAVRTEERPSEAQLTQHRVEGSRLSLALPSSLRRSPHGLRFHDPERQMTLEIGDATVARGQERSAAEATLAAIAGRATIRPTTISGAAGVDVTLADAERPVRALALWDTGALARIVIRYRPEDSELVERIVASVTFERERPLDPLAVLDVRIDTADLELLSVSNEQLLLREGGQVVAFPSEAAAVDVTWLSFDVEGRPHDEHERGRLLGALFAGLELEGTELSLLPEATRPAIEIVSSTRHAGATLALYGAYVEADRGAWLVRGSVSAEHAREWGPRFRAVVRSLER